jgi:hypothetical protein
VDANATLANSFNGTIIARTGLLAHDNLREPFGSIQDNHPLGPSLTHNRLDANGLMAPNGIDRGSPQQEVQESHRAFTSLDRDRILKLEMQLDAIRSEVVEETREAIKEQNQALLSDVHRIVDDLVARVRVDVQYIGNSCIQDLKKLSDDMDAESETRARSDIDTHSKLAHDSAGLRTKIEETRIMLEEQNNRDRQAHSEAVVELRALIDSVWNNFTQIKSSSGPGFSYRVPPENESDGPCYKDFVGDEQDINTCFEMAQQALGDNIMMKQELDEEKAKRIKENAEFRREAHQLDCRCQKLHKDLESLHRILQV